MDDFFIPFRQALVRSLRAPGVTASSDGRVVAANLFDGYKLIGQDSNPRDGTVTLAIYHSDLGEEISVIVHSRSLRRTVNEAGFRHPGRSEAEDTAAFASVMLLELLDTLETTIDAPHHLGN